MTDEGTGTDPLPCIVCDKTITPVFPGLHFPGRVYRGDIGPVQPKDAVTFYSYGQYGSTVFDPQDESQLRINVCDECLLRKTGQVWHERHLRRIALTVFSKPWNPATETEEVE